MVYIFGNTHIKNRMEEMQGFAICKTLETKFNLGGLLNFNPFEKYELVKIGWFPKGSGWKFPKKTYLKFETT